MKERYLSINEKLRVLELSEILGSVAAACRQAGISRSSFYAIKKDYDRDGKAGLEPKPRRAPRMPNAFPEETIQKILETTSRFPAFSCDRLGLQLRDEGVAASGSGVRKVWKRHGLARREERLLWLKRSAA